MAKKKQDTFVPVSKNQMVYRTEFENIYDIISSHKKLAMKAVHNESFFMLSVFVPTELALISDNSIVPFETAQIGRYSTCLQRWLLSTRSSCRLTAFSSAASWNSAIS